MQKHYQSNLVKNIKLMSLLCFLFLGLAGCNKGNQVPQIGGGNDTRPSNPAQPTPNNDRSDIAAKLTAPTISLSDNIGGSDLSLFSVGSDLQLEGYQILYQVEIASDEEFSDIVYDEHVSVQEVDINGTVYYTPDFENVNWPSLTTGQTYHIRVRRVARKSGEDDIVGAYSGAVEFAAPDLTCFTPVLQTTTIASNQQSHVLNFSIHASNADCGSASAALINSHEIEVASDEEFSNIEYTNTMSHQVNLLDLANLSRSFTLTSTLNDGTYYWRVRNRVVLTTGDVVVGPYSGGVELIVGD